MPNNTFNKILIMNDHYSKEEFSKKINSIIGDNEILDFQKIIPRPKEEEDNWHDWNRENWGTKWNSYSTNIINNEEYEFTMTFETAWSPPVPIINKIIEMFKGCLIKYVSICEGGFFYIMLTVDENGLENQVDYKGNKSIVELIETLIR